MPAAAVTTVGLFVNEAKAAAREAAATLAADLEPRGVVVRAREALASQVGHGCCPATEAELAACDFVVSLGGDGTLLAAARLLAPHHTPILGVHLGRFGFITEAAPGDLLTAVHRTLDGDCRIEERGLLEGQVLTDSENPNGAPRLALNDVVVASGVTRMVHVRTQIGAHFLATYAADGVIVASPTGSTGYSLSAGGPLIHPTAPVLLITPICPHTLNARTLVIPDTETVRLTIGERSEARDVATAAFDGQIQVPLAAGDTVQITRSPHRLRLITVGGPSFYDKIRTRWHYGERRLPGEQTGGE